MARLSTQQGVFANATPMVLIVCFFMAIGEATFGYDVSSFGGVQAIPAFKARFGHCDAVTGKCALSTTRTAIMNSFGAIGSMIGTLTVGMFIEYFGHRYALVAMVVFNYTAAILEITARSPIQFVVGRIILSIGVSFVEVSVPTYQSEIVPASMRGFVVASLQFFLIIGALVAKGVNKAFSHGTTESAWRVPVGMTFIFPTIVLCSLPFLPDAPRWLLFKGRREDALNSLRRVRKKADFDAGLCEQEIEAIEIALEHQRVKAPWGDLFKGTNRRRTLIACCTFSLQQCTGQSFNSSYAVVFYQSINLGVNKSFTYPIITSAISMFCVVACMYSLDRFGRRPVYIIGGFAQAIFLFLVAGLGGRPNPTQAEINGLVAAFILTPQAFAMSWAPAPYVTASEMATGSLREKTMSMAASCNVFFSWLVSFVLPYLLNKPYAGLGPKVGYIFGSICCMISVYAYLFIPETKGRSLEELDELFEKNLWAWQFSTYETTGAGHRVAMIENNKNALEDVAGSKGREEVEMWENRGNTEGTDTKDVAQV